MKMPRAVLTSSIIATLAILQWLGADIAAAPGIPDVRTLSNGLQVVLLEDHSLPYVAVSLWVHSGSKNESASTAGYAHFLEHIVQRGTEAAGPHEYTLRANRWGGTLSVRSNYDRTHITMTGVPSALGELLDAVSSMALQAKLEDSEIDKELRVLGQEMRSYYDLPASVAFLESMRAGFPSHPYRFAMLGNITALGRLKSEPLTAFYRRLYVANNMALALVGDIDPREAMKRVESAFGKGQRSDSLPQPTTPPALFAGHDKIEKRLRIKELWTTIAIIGPGFRHPDRPAFEVMARALASPSRSPFLQPLQRTSSGSLAHVSNYLMEDASLLYIALNPITPQLSYTAAQAVVEGLMAFKEQPLTMPELRGHVEELLLSERSQAEDISTRAERLGEAALFGGVRYYWDLPHVYDSLTPADVKRVADRYLVEENLRVVVLLPEDSPPLSQQREEFFQETLDRLGSAGEDLATGLDEVLYPPAKATRVTADAWGDPRSAGGLAEPQRMVLANGLTVVVLEDHRHSLAASSLHLALGSGSDPEGKEGMANLNLRLLASETASRWLAKANTEEAWMAVRPEMQVSRDLSEMRFRCDPAALPAGLEALAGAIRDSTAPSAGLLDQAREVALMEIEHSQQDPAHVGLTLFREQVYAGHRYAHPPAGTAVGLKAISPTDLTNFRSRLLRPSKAFLTVVGDVQAAEVLELARSHFGAWSDEHHEQSSEETPAAVEAETHGEVALATSGAHAGTLSRLVRAPQSRIILGVPGVPLSNPEFPALRFLGAALTAELFEDLIYTRRAAFSARALPEGFRDGGSLAIEVVTPHPELKKAIFELHRLLRRMASVDLSPETLQTLGPMQAGKRLAGTQGVLALASALAFREAAGLGADSYLQEFAPPTFSAERVRDLAARFLKPEVWISVEVGPAAR